MENTVQSVIKESVLLRKTSGLCSKCKRGLPADIVEKKRFGLYGQAVSRTWTGRSSDCLGCKLV